jgi:hypothetical protein
VADVLKFLVGRSAGNDPTRYETVETRQKRLLANVVLMTELAFLALVLLCGLLYSLAWEWERSTCEMCRSAGRASTLDGMEQFLGLRPHPTAGLLEFSWWTSNLGWMSPFEHEPIGYHKKKSFYDTAVSAVLLSPRISWRKHVLRAIVARDGAVREATYDTLWASVRYSPSGFMETRSIDTNPGFGHSLPIPPVVLVVSASIGFALLSKTLYLRYARPAGNSK